MVFCSVNYVISIMKLFRLSHFVLISTPYASLILAVAFFYANVSIAADTEWPNYGGNQWNERHADLKQITPRNVADLVPRRVLQMGVIGAGG